MEIGMQVRQYTIAAIAAIIDSEIVAGLYHLCCCRVIATAACSVQMKGLDKAFVDLSMSVFSFS